MSSKVVNQRAEAMNYLNKHKVLKLFDILGSQLAKEKPDDPNEFLIAELTRIMEKKSAKEPVSLFTETDIENMFAIFDLTGREYVTQVQYRKGKLSSAAINLHSTPYDLLAVLSKALNAVGIEIPTLPIPEGDQIDKATFVKHL